ncbi:hypothetical protein DSO57_1029597 [Entomophthora muscae]|uniref:Uncharacterized protein n=1 Tax=Entomophthora muscae TaxID=34485 RepID=A0ACC2TN68_9FUNG|nr:hypothetical protein DSO57_1029597 [Entomophthora muscae]
MPNLLHWASSLAFLELRRCELDSFPFELLRQMPQLVALDVSSNQIHRFEASTPTVLSKLKWLNLAANRIASIAKLYSVLLPTVPRLKALDLRENPLGTSLCLDHSDPNVSTMYQAALRSQLPCLVKLDGRRLS